MASCVYLGPLEPLVQAPGSFMAASYELSVGCLYMEPKVQVVPREISMEMFKECSTMHVSAHTKPVWNLNKDSPWKQIFSHYY